MKKGSLEAGITYAIENNYVLYLYHFEKWLGVLNPELAHVLTDDGVFINGDHFICYDAISDYKLKEKG